MKNLNPEFTHPGEIGLYAYIDESGDEGFTQGKSQDWFVLGAFIVDRTSHRPAFDVIDGIKKAIAFKDIDDELHWRNLRHEKKKVVVRHLAELPFTSIAVVMWKWGLSAEDRANLSVFPRLYFFVVKCMLERLSWLARDKKTLVEITFSNRAHISYGLLEHYLFKALRSEDTNHSIDFNFLGPMRVIQNKQRKLLQAADAVASGLLNGIQRNFYGDLETSYMDKLNGKFWRRNGKLYGYGIKLLPSNEEAEIKKSNELFSLLS